MEKDQVLCKNLKNKKNMTFKANERYQTSQGKIKTKIQKSRISSIYQGRMI